VICLAKAAKSNTESDFQMGDPYYCPECDRNHIKGQIYKDHLKYAEHNNNGSEEEKEEQEEEAFEDAIDEDEELEAIEEEMEEEMLDDDGDTEIDEEQDEEEREEEEEPVIADEIMRPKGKSYEECVDEVENLPGVGSATLSKLIDSGFSSLESIAFTPASIIREESGLGEKTTEKIIEASMKQLNVGFKSAKELWNQRRNLAQITTGSQELDALLSGGIETGSVIEFFGEYRTGKTQIMHQLCVNVQLPEEQGGLEGAALYIDTEGTFRPERIIQMAEALDLDHKKVLKNVVFGRAYNSDHQILLIKEAANLIKKKNIKLIVVDSLIGHFRSEYVGRGTLADRQQTINQHLHDLLRLCDIYPELAIAITNQVQARPNVFYGNPIKAAGGNIIAHGCTIRIYLRKGKGEQRVAKVVDAPHLPEGEAVFSITEEGITD